MVKSSKKYILILLLISCVCVAFQYGEGLTPSEERGKLIYTKGMRASGEPIIAKLSGAQFDAKILPCSNCHGRWGEGNPEGGVEPSPLSWRHLTKPYYIEFKNGRKRKGYDRNSLKRAVAKGIDPSENELDLVMPRYSLSNEDVADLISYLKIIDKQDIAGVSDSTINVGIILPSNGRLMARSEILVKTIKAYLDLINRGGGIYNRKFSLIEIYVENKSDEVDSVIVEILERENIFAFIGSDLEILPPKSFSKLKEDMIPVIGALNGNIRKGDYLDNEFYYLLPELNQEIRALTHFASYNLNAGKEDFTILMDSSFVMSREEVEALFVSEDFTIVDVSDADDQSVLMAKLKKTGIRHCLFLGDVYSSYTFLENTQEINWTPNILLPGRFATYDWLSASEKMDQKIYFSYSNWKTERKEKAMEQYYHMASRYRLNTQFLSAQLDGLAATILFTEVMKLTGKEVSRELMLESLYGQQNFETGYTPPLSFGPNKRIGSEKVFIARVDIKNKKLKLMN